MKYIVLHNAFIKNDKNEHAEIFVLLPSDKIPDCTMFCGKETRGVFTGFKMNGLEFAVVEHPQEIFNLLTKAYGSKIEEVK